MKGIVLDTPFVRLICDDALGTPLIEPASIDLIVTSPPYNLDLPYADNPDNLPYEAYLDFQERWLRRAWDWLKPDGRLCLNVPLDTNKGGAKSIAADLTTLAKKIGFGYRATIIWNEGNISRRTAWGSWLSASAPYVIAPVEVILVLYKHSWRKLQSGLSDISREEFIEWTNGLWTFSGESKKRAGHPAPFPIELPKRCIKLFSYVGDVVLDPFVGSGTTLLAALQTHRRGIGIEISPSYCSLAMERLRHKGQLSLAFPPTEKAEEFPI